MVNWSWLQLYWVFDFFWWLGIWVVRLQFFWYGFFWSGKVNEQVGYVYGSMYVILVVVWDVVLSVLFVVVVLLCFVVIGLGYVGLLLVVVFGWYWLMLGFDIDVDCIVEFCDGQDYMLEMEVDELVSVQQLQYGSDLVLFDVCNVYIVIVLILIDVYEQFDLELLCLVMWLIVSYLCVGDLVIYEFMVYFGIIEEVCVLLLEQFFGLCFNEDFYCGYSLEWVSFGDCQWCLVDICKIILGLILEVVVVIDGLYQCIIVVGIFLVLLMCVVEVVKVVENIQCDVNIVLVNELVLIFDWFGIDIQDVFDVVGSKWNFLLFWLGLVGGYCIGVDLYYLLYKLESVGYYLDLIYIVWQVNNCVGEYVVLCVLVMLVECGCVFVQLCILVLGVIFKEDCLDLCNSCVLELVQCLCDGGVQVEVSDLWVGLVVLVDVGVYWLVELVVGSYDVVVLVVVYV